MTPEEVLRLAARIEGQTGPAVIVSAKDKKWLAAVLRRLARMMPSKDTAS